jgi:DNA-binding transcriptional ArsR family regulator
LLKPALSEAQRQIIDLLESEARNWTTAEIVKATEKGKSAVGNLLLKMKGGGLIESPERGQWRAKGEFTNSLPLREMQTLQTSETVESAPETTKAEELEIW